MGLKKETFEFIDDIPNEKLNDISENSHTIYKNTDFRLDMQNITKDGKLNLQVQVNSRPETTTLKRVQNQSVAMYHADQKKDKAATIKTGLKAGYLFVA